MENEEWGIDGEFRRVLMFTDLTEQTESTDKTE